MSYYVDFRKLLLGMHPFPRKSEGTPPAASPRNRVPDAVSGVRATTRLIEGLYYGKMFAYLIVSFCVLTLSFEQLEETTFSQDSCCRR